MAKVWRWQLSLRELMLVIIILALVLSLAIAQLETRIRREEIAGIRDVAKHFHPEFPEAQIKISNKHGSLQSGIVLPFNSGLPMSLATGGSHTEMDDDRRGWTKVEWRYVGTDSTGDVYRIVVSRHDLSAPILDRLTLFSGDNLTVCDLPQLKVEILGLPATGPASKTATAARETN